jgi:hypothetical protein
VLYLIDLSLKQRTLEIFRFCRLYSMQMCAQPYARALHVQYVVCTLVISLYVPYDLDAVHLFRIHRIVNTRVDC